MRIHVLTLAGMHDEAIGEADGPWWEAPTAWSPDGHRLLIERSIDDLYGAVIVDVDGHGPDVIPAFRSLDDWFAAWSPDGTTILATPGDAAGNGLQQQLWDARTGGIKSIRGPPRATHPWHRVAQ